MEKGVVIIFLINIININYVENTKLMKRRLIKF